MSSETYGDSHPNVSDDSSDYETVAVTDEDIDRVLDGKVVDLGEYTWSDWETMSKSDLKSAGTTILNLRDGSQETISWPEHDFAIVYNDEDDCDTMDFSTEDEAHTENDMKSIDDADRTHVTMEVTMEIGDLDDVSKRIICELARQYEDSFREVTEKSRDYSWSFLTTGTKLAQSEGTPFDSPTRCQAFTLLSRIGDKHERLIENVYGDGDAAVSDEADVTAQEAANYYQLLAFVLGNPKLSKKASDA